MLSIRAATAHVPELPFCPIVDGINSAPRGVTVIVITELSRQAIQEASCDVVI